MNPMYERPALIYTQRMTVPNQQSDIEYPVVAGLNNPAVEYKINADIVGSVNRLFAMQINQLKEQGYTVFNLSITGNYEVKTNERGVLSLTILNYTIATPAAHGLTFIKSLNFDTATGKNYSLSEQFKPGSDYVKVLSENISAQIKTREIPTLDSFGSIKPEQDYYIADKALVIYFQQYEITPGYVGSPMFPISIYEIQDLINENSPLGMMFS